MGRGGGGFNKQNPCKTSPPYKLRKGVLLSPLFYMPLSISFVNKPHSDININILFVKRPMKHNKQLGTRGPVPAMTWGP